MHIKKMLIGAAASILMLGSMATSAFAATPNWDVTGFWDFSNTSTKWPGTYQKTMTITQDSAGNFTGTGNNVPAGNTWNVAGNVNGDAINVTLTYDAPMSGYVATLVGTINPDGSMNGTWSDVMYGDTGTWASTIGKATAIVAAAACPEGTTKASSALETVTVPASKDTDTDSVNPLVSGTKYVLKARGTADAGDGITFDARYSFRTGSSTLWTDAVSTYEGYGITLLDLLYNNTTPWGVYNASNEYEASVTGTGSVAHFRIYDIYYPNNTGNLLVDIYSCVPNTPSLPTSKDQCKKDGWKAFGVFKNQGDCVSYVATGGKNPPAN